MKRQRITCDPEIMMGKPTIRGTRITVEYVLRMAAAGHSRQDIIDEHPHMTRDDISAAFEFAADHLQRTWKEGALQEVRPQQVRKVE